MRSMSLDVGTRDYRRSRSDLMGMIATGGNNPSYQ